MDKHDIFRTLAADVAQGELAFPTSARIVMKVMQALDDPGCQLDTAAKLVQAEPLLAARVVATANSVAFNRSGREITDLRSAVMRLGFRAVRSLTMALVTRQMAGSPSSPQQQELTARLWEHTAHVTALAHVIARRFTHVDPETALFVGLVHEVAGFYMLSRTTEFPELLDGDFRVWMQSGEAEVGRAVLKVLALPSPVNEALEYYWSGYLAIPPVTLGDTLLLAVELAPFASPLHKLPDQDGLNGAPSRMDITIGEEVLSSILEESAEEVASLTAALKF
jgi:HD-like signal output (HDOD) protein